jgi:hypothetical protein
MTGNNIEGLATDEFLEQITELAIIDEAIERIEDSLRTLYPILHSSIKEDLHKMFLDPQDSKFRRGKICDGFLINAHLINISSTLPQNVETLSLGGIIVTRHQEPILNIPIESLGKNGKEGVRIFNQIIPSWKIVGPKEQGEDWTKKRMWQWEDFRDYYYLLSSFKSHSDKYSEIDATAEPFEDGYIQMDIWNYIESMGEN